MAKIQAWNLGALGLSKYVRGNVRIVLAKRCHERGWFVVLALFTRSKSPELVVWNFHAPTGELQSGKYFDIHERSKARFVFDEAR